MRAQCFPLAVLVPVPETHWDGDLAADLFAPDWTPWLAVFDGVSYPRDYTLGGYTILLVADDGTEAYYAHGFPSRVSGRVQAGQVIGYVDRSGNAAQTPPHLHFAVGVINANGGGTISPAEWLDGVLPPEPPDGEPIVVGAPGMGLLILGGLMAAGGVALIMNEKRGGRQP